MILGREKCINGSPPVGTPGGKGEDAAHSWKPSQGRVDCMKRNIKSDATSPSKHLKAQYAVAIARKCLRIARKPELLRMARPVAPRRSQAVLNCEKRLGWVSPISSPDFHPCTVDSIVIISRLRMSFCRLVARSLVIIVGSSLWSVFPETSLRTTAHRGLERL
jgi:hypothetical protein